MDDRFESFVSRQGVTPRVVRVRLREEVPSKEAAALEAALDAVPWPRLSDAYGPAEAVPGQLYAVTLGDADTRKAAWWELWGNIHHQGTVYEATVPAVSFMASLAREANYPDRVEALSFLRQVAVGDGEHADAVRTAVRPHAIELVDALGREPALVQRAVVWLASAFPSLAAQHEELVRFVPEPMRGTWDEVLDRVRRRRDPDVYDDADDAAFDREADLERWGLAGWTEPSAGGSDSG